MSYYIIHCGSNYHSSLPLLSPPPRPPSLPLTLTWGKGDAIALGVEWSAHLRQVTVPLRDVLDAGRLHHVGILTVTLLHPLHALLVGLGVHRRVL